MGSSTSTELVCVPHVQTSRFMGTWFVIGVLPTPFETTCENAVEKYSFRNNDDETRIDIDFTYRNEGDKKRKLRSLPQRGWVNDPAVGSEWKVQAFWPLKMPYKIIELDAEYDSVVIGYPSRKYAWIMGRKPTMDEKKYRKYVDDLSKKHGYDEEFVNKHLRKVPQNWDEEEKKLRDVEEVF